MKRVFISRPRLPSQPYGRNFFSHREPFFQPHNSGHLPHIPASCYPALPLFVRANSRTHTGDHQSCYRVFQLGPATTEKQERLYSSAVLSSTGKHLLLPVSFSVYGALGGRLCYCMLISFLLLGCCDNRCMLRLLFLIAPAISATTSHPCHGGRWWWSNRWSHVDARSVFKA